ncbi:hypothetical protein EG834_14715 [bacterium]|nr:hypothetical protein [bacterium]
MKKMTETARTPDQSRLKRLWHRAIGAMNSHKPWRKVRHILGLDRLSPAVRRVVVSVLGGVVLTAGVVMVVLPGPAFLVIPLGLIILATEYLWARRILQKVRGLFQKARGTAG